MKNSLTFTAILCWLLGCSPYQLIIEDTHTHRELISLSLNDNETLTYRYIHSVEGTMIEEIWQVRGGRLYSIASHSRGFGLGHIPRSGTAITTRDHHIHTRYPPILLDDLYLYTGDSTSPDMQLIWRGQTIALSHDFPSHHLLCRIEQPEMK